MQARATRLTVLQVPFMLFSVVVKEAILETTIAVDK